MCIKNISRCVTNVTQRKKALQEICPTILCLLSTFFAGMLHLRPNICDLTAYCNKETFYTLPPNRDG